MTDAGRRLLAIEAATDRLSIALFEGDVVRAMCFAPGLRRHAAELLPTLEAILDEAGVGLEAVDAIAVSSGPGSFTSLRIGLSTVKGLAFGRAVETIGVSTLETMAFGALAGAGDVAVGEDEWVVALLDARRGETYAGGFARGAGTLPECVLAEGLYGPESLAAELADRRVVLVSPEGPDWCRDFAPRAGGAVRVVSGEAAGPRAVHSVGSRSDGWIGARASRRVRSPRAICGGRRPRRSGSGSRRRRGWPPGSTSPTSARAGCRGGTPRAEPGAAPDAGAT